MARGTHIVIAQPYYVKHLFRLYRIPAIVRVGNVLLVACEGRMNDHDFFATTFGLFRSTDGGRTWSESIMIPLVANVCLNTPLFLYDEKHGMLHFFYAKSLSAATKAAAEKGYDKSTLSLISSKDTGLTWSKVKEFDLESKPGPGHGIQIAHGRFAGRLVVPVRTENVGVRNVYSDDGKSWSVGKHGVLGGEVQVVEAGSRIVAIPRRSCGGRPAHKFLWYSYDGGVSFNESWRSPSLLESYAGCGLLRVPQGILYSCPPLAAKGCADHSARRLLTVRLSMDEGKSWPYALVIDPGLSSYSDLALGKMNAEGEQEVHIAYERGVDRFDEEVVFATFTVEEVMRSRINPQAFTFGKRVQVPVQRRRRRRQ